MISFLFATSLIISAEDSFQSSKNCGSGLHRINSEGWADRLKDIIQNTLLKKESPKSFWAASQNYKFKASQLGALHINGSELLLLLSSTDGSERRESVFNREFTLSDSSGALRHHGVIPYLIPDDSVDTVYVYPAALSAKSSDSLVFKSESGLLYWATIHPSRRSKITARPMGAEEAQHWARAWRSNKLKSAELFWSDRRVLDSKTVVNGFLANLRGSTNRTFTAFQIFRAGGIDGFTIAGTNLDALVGFQPKDAQLPYFVLFQTMHSDGPDLTLAQRKGLNSHFSGARMLGVHEGSQLISGYQPEGDVEWAAIVEVDGSPMLVIYERSLRANQKERRAESFFEDQIVFLDALSLRKILAFKASEAFAGQMSTRSLRLWRYLRHSFGLEKSFAAGHFSD
jgi:hypothetical protein